jgi:hypothetical protein
MKKHLFLMMIAAAAITFAGCKPEADEQDDTKPGTEQPGNGDNNGNNGGNNGSSALSIDKTAIDAAYTAGTYQLQVTATQAWSAEANTAATWCTISPDTYAGSRAVTVGVEDNPTAGVQRAATITFTSGTLTRTVDVTQAALPTLPNAASTQTWAYGNQTWSDAIHIPACNKASFTNSDTDPVCRSYTEGGKTWYYYNWAYVNQNATTLCPSPWRVPSQTDFNTLVNATNRTTLIAAWGYGGFASGSSVTGVNSGTPYWSTSECVDYYAYALLTASGSLSVACYYPYYGLQVRCVSR